MLRSERITQQWVAAMLEVLPGWLGVGLFFEGRALLSSLTPCHLAPSWPLIRPHCFSGCPRPCPARSKHRGAASPAGSAPAASWGWALPIARTSGRWVLLQRAQPSLWPPCRKHVPHLVGCAACDCPFVCLFSTHQPRILVHGAIMTGLLLGPQAWRIELTAAAPLHSVAGPHPGARPRHSPGILRD